MTPDRKKKNEDGQALVLFALLVVAIMTLAAIVIDLGQLRNTRRSNARIADLAALAAGPALAKDNTLQACLDAFTYVKSNAPDLSSSAAVNCAPIGAVAGANCDPTQPKDAVVTGASPYTLTIRYPVPNSDAAMQTGQFTTGEQDGLPCERMLVSLQRTNGASFSAVVGAKTLSTHASAVVRSIIGSPPITPTLWLLDPFGCGTGGAGAFVVDGGAQVTVGTPSLPGIVTLDSDGTACNGTQTTLSTSGSGSSLTAVPAGAATINLFAMPAGATTCNAGLHHDCDASAVSASTVSPQPIPLAARATRAPIDWLYNCKTGYPAFDGAITINDCPRFGTLPPYVDDLATAVGTSVGSAPPGFIQWSSIHSCSPGSLTLAVGNYWIDCPTFKIKGGATVDFAGGNAVFDGNIDVTAGSLTFNDANTRTLSSSCQRPAWVGVTCIATSSPNAAFIFMRNGNLSTSGTSAISLDHTFVYQAPGTGSISVSGGSNPVWTAPTEGPFGPCVTAENAIESPSPGCSGVLGSDPGLALWSEDATGYTLGGSGSLSTTGIFFTPLAQPFKITGSFPSQQVHAQFVSFDLQVSGGATLTMVPPSDTALQVFPPRYQLIR